MLIFCKIQLIFCKIQPLQLNYSRSNTVAVPGEKLKIIGYTVFDDAFGNNIEHSEKRETWVSAKDGWNPNKLVKDFISQIIETITFFFSFKLKLKENQPKQN